MEVGVSLPPKGVPKVEYDRYDIDNRLRNKNKKGCEKSNLICQKNHNKRNIYSSAGILNFLLKS